MKMQASPRILAFDTSGPYCVAALLAGDRVVACHHEEMKKGQAERLMPMLSEALEDAGVDWGALDAIGVGEALEDRHLDATVVDRVGRVPVIADARRRGRLPVGSGDAHQTDAEDDHGEDGQREPELALLGSTPRRRGGLGGALDLLGRTCFTHERQR